MDKKRRTTFEKYDSVSPLLTYVASDAPYKNYFDDNPKPQSKKTSADGKNDSASGIEEQQRQREEWRSKREAREQEKSKEDKLKVREDTKDSKPQPEKRKEPSRKPKEHKPRKKEEKKEKTYEEDDKGKKSSMMYSMWQDSNKTAHAGDRPKSTHQILSKIPTITVR